MLTFMISIICYCFFTFFFYQYFYMIDHKYRWIRALLAMVFAFPALDVHSLCFIFELHFIFFSLCIKGILLFRKRNHSFQKRNVVLIPISLLLTFAWIGYGSYNMLHIQRTSYLVETKKELTKNYRFLFLSDLHYPTTMQASDLKQLTSRLEKEQADMLFLGGDIIDEYTTVSEIEEVFSILGKLSETIPVYYVFGNHDQGKYGWQQQMSKAQLKNCIRSSGIQVLEDDAVLFNQEILIFGRKELSDPTRRQTIPLTHDDFYTIVLDHQPKDLKVCSQQSADLHLSGHTHAGQIFPLYYLYEWFSINELNAGKEQIGMMTAINSSGAAGWGFPLRTQGSSEYVVIDLVERS